MCACRLEGETGRQSTSPMYIVGVYCGVDKLGEGMTHLCIAWLANFVAFGPSISTAETRVGHKYTSIYIRI